MANKNWAIGQAIEITKEYARGGGSMGPSTVLEQVFNKLMELGQGEEEHASIVMPRR